VTVHRVADQRWWPSEQGVGYSPQRNKGGAEGGGHSRRGKEPHADRNPPSEKPYEKPEGERRGIVIVNTGDGKGKSTAAFGLALRAHGRGKAVKIYQFMKVPSALRRTPHVRADRHSDRRAGRRLQLEEPGPGTLGQLARDGWEKAKAAILSGDFFLVVLDEITYPLIYGWLPLEGVLETLRARPKHVHVVLTGRRCPPELIELADTVTEMTLVKHAFKAGIPAQRGIED
jgi:cob(I)alamin adenosyltransferase